MHTDQPHPEPYSRGTEEMGELGMSESGEQAGQQGDRQLHLDTLLNICGVCSVELWLVGD